MKIYFNNRCSKCHKAKDYLERNNINFNIIEYLESGLSKKEITDVLKKGNYNILDILRKNEEEYKLDIKDKDLSEDQIINILSKYPKLLQRPLIVDKKRALIARDEEALELIKNW